MKHTFLVLALLVAGTVSNAMVELGSFSLLTTTEMKVSSAREIALLNKRVSVKMDGSIFTQNSKGVTKKVGQLDDDTLGMIFSLIAKAKSGELVLKAPGIVCQAISDHVIDVVALEIQPNDAVARIPLYSAVKPCGKVAKHSTQAGRDLAKFALDLFAMY